MSFGERKEARMLYDGMCDGSDAPLNKDQLETLKYIFEKESVQNEEALKLIIEEQMQFVPKPVAEARAIGQLVAGTMQMSEIAPRLFFTALELEEKLSRARETLAFAESVIKSGESWTNQCQEMFDQARK